MNICKTHKSYSVCPSHHSHHLLWSVAPAATPSPLVLVYPNKRIIFLSYFSKVFFYSKYVSLKKIEQKRPGDESPWKEMISDIRMWQYEVGDVMSDGRNGVIEMLPHPVIGQKEQILRFNFLNWLILLLIFKFFVKIS